VQVPAVEVCHCADCGEDFLNPEQSHALAVAVKNEVRKKLGLLPPERITAIRERPGLTQATEIHLCPKQVFEVMGERQGCPPATAASE